MTNNTQIFRRYGEKTKPTGKSVLLFSGGLDSIIFNKLLNPDILLNIPFNAKYSAVEKERINGMIYSNAVDSVDPKKIIVLDNIINFKKFERDYDQVIPNRNAHLILLAANYGETIYLCGVRGDGRSNDKDETFYYLIQNLLNHMHQEQGWTYKREFKISSPYELYTKTELVNMFLEKGGKPEDLLYSYSCFIGGNKPCGHCKPCVRKFVALVNNGILSKSEGKAYFENDPMEARWVLDNLPLLRLGQYRDAKEDADVVRVYDGK